MSAIFTSGSDWGVLFATFLLIVPIWGTIKTFQDQGRLSQQTYENVQNAFAAAGGCGSFVLRSTGLLIGLQIVRNLALWITFTLYLLTSPTIVQQTEDDLVDPGLFFRTIYIVNAALIFSGTVFHVLSEITFYDVGWFGTSFGLRILEALTFTAALVTVIVELVCLPEMTQCGEEIALLVVLAIIVVHNLLVLLPRNYYFWQFSDASREFLEGNDRLLASATKYESVPNTRVNQTYQKHNFK